MTLEELTTLNRGEGGEIVARASERERFVRLANEEDKLPVRAGLSCPPGARTRISRRIQARRGGPRARD